MIITYDDSKKTQIDNGLEDTLGKLNTAINYADGISVPYGFSRANDIGNTVSALRNA